MRSSTPKLSDEEELYAVALRSLGRRAYSVHEMRTYLERRADDEGAVNTVLDRLKSHGYLDDARYARQFVRLRAETRKQGAFRIARDLRAKGVPDRHIDAALLERAAEADEGAALRGRLERRIKSIQGPLDERKIASLYRGLLRAGFSAEAIRRELRRITKAQLEGMPENSQEEP